MFCIKTLISSGLHESIRYTYSLSVLFNIRNAYNCAQAVKCKDLVVDLCCTILILCTVLMTYYEPFGVWVL